MNEKTTKLAKSLYKLSLTAGSIDADKVSLALDQIKTISPASQLTVLRTYRKLVSLKVRQTTALVASATKIEDAERQALEKKLGDNLSYEYTLNPQLLGGLKIRVGDSVFDNSLLIKFESLKVIN